MKRSLGFSLALSGVLLLSGCSAALEKSGMYLLERTAVRPSFEPYQPTGEEEARMAKANTLVAAGRNEEAGRIYEALARKGYPEALWLFAGWGAVDGPISNHRCDEKNQRVDWSVEKLADQGDIDAILFYWNCLNQDGDWLHDTGKGLYYLEHLAEQDNLTALALLYRYRMSWYRHNTRMEPEKWTVRRREARYRTPDMKAAARWLRQYAQIISSTDRGQIRRYDFDVMNEQFLAMANTYMKLGEDAKALAWYEEHQAILEDLLAHPEELNKVIWGHASRAHGIVDRQIKLARKLLGGSA